MFVPDAAVEKEAQIKEAVDQVLDLAARARLILTRENVLAFPTDTELQYGEELGQFVALHSTNTLVSFLPLPMPTLPAYNELRDLVRLLCIA